MTALAARTRAMRETKAGDGRQAFSWIRTPASRPTLTQAETLVAMARPSTPSQPWVRNQKNRPDPRTTVMITAVTAKYMGRRVSSRAKNPGRKTRISTEAGRPAAKAASAAETARVSSAEKAPR